MSNLVKRLRKLENPHSGKYAGLVIANLTEDGGIVSKETMRRHESTDDLLKCLGKDPDRTLVVKCSVFGVSAEELLHRWQTMEAQT